MIIDEATSALDAETQRDVQLELDQLLRQSGASALVIAHRLSTLRRCNKFVVLRPATHGQPQIEAIASSLEELCHLSPTYRRLRDLETGGIASPLSTPMAEV